jgi:enoyl-[acyl-carrier protein] reductase II
MQKADFDSTVTSEEFEKMGVGAVRAAAVNGDNEKGSFLAGQIAGMVSKRQSAAEIVEELFEETERLLLQARQWVV